MAQILCFSRNRCTGVEQVDEHTLKSFCRLQDTLTDAFVEIRVRLPDLEIVGVSAEVRRGPGKELPNPSESLQKVLGIRIGPSVLKIIKGLVGQEREYRQLAFMVGDIDQMVVRPTADGIQHGQQPATMDNVQSFAGFV